MVQPSARFHYPIALCHLPIDSGSVGGLCASSTPAAGGHNNTERALPAEKTLLPQRSPSQGRDSSARPLECQPTPCVAEA